MHKISVLSNGIRVVTERTDYVKSVALGVWIGAGSAMESRQNNGTAHFIEHTLFKGTEKRTAKDIAECMDRVGGQLNAVTAKEYTCYYAKTLTEHYKTAIDVLADMLLNSTFTAENINTERKVIAEEINMCDDTPEDYIHDCLSRIMWREGSLGLPIAGTLESLKRIDRETMLDFKNRLYCGENTVISAVGCFDEGELLEELEKKLGAIPRTKKATTAQQKLKVTRGTDILRKDIEQCHVCLGLEGFKSSDPRVYELLTVNAILGGNMSSRLFQRVREERGLAYSIYSYVNTYAENGSFVIYAGLNNDGLGEALRLIGNEIREVKAQKLTEQELEIAKTQLKASVIMGLEGISSRMSAYGKALLLENRVRNTEDTIKLIDRVNISTVADTIDQVFNIDKLNIAVTGRLDGKFDGIANEIDF